MMRQFQRHSVKEYASVTHFQVTMKLESNSKDAISFYSGSVSGSFLLQKRKIDIWLAFRTLFIRENNTR